MAKQDSGFCLRAIGKVGRNTGKHGLTEYWITFNKHTNN